MAEAVQRALDNLRFDRMVKTFSIISPDNEIFQSTMDPETESMIKQTVSLYKGKISQLTVNTDQGIVVISKIAKDWLLAVLFPENLSLGIAVVKTKATLLALRELDLNILKALPAAAPTTPEKEEEAIANLETVAPLEPPPPPTPMEDEPATTEPAEPTPAPSESEPPVEIPSEAVAEPTAPQPIPVPTKGRIDLTFIPLGGESLLAALDKGSPVGGALHEKFGPYARDVLFLVDGKRDVKTIAFLLGLPEYAIVEVLEFAMTNKILAQAV